VFKGAEQKSFCVGDEGNAGVSDVSLLWKPLVTLLYTEVIRFYTDVAIFIF
jgi:hypothetical protein